MRGGAGRCGAVRGGAGQAGLVYPWRGELSWQVIIISVARRPTRHNLVISVARCEGGEPSRAGLPVTLLTRLSCTELFMDPQPRRWKFLIINPITIVPNGRLVASPGVSLIIGDSYA